MIPGGGAFVESTSLAAAGPCSLGAPSLRPLAPLMLPLKWPCSRPGTAAANPKLGVYICIYIFGEVSYIQYKLS